MQVNRSPKNILRQTICQTKRGLVISYSIHLEGITTPLLPFRLLAQVCHSLCNSVYFCEGSYYAWKDTAVHLKPGLHSVCLVHSRQYLFMHPLPISLCSPCGHRLRLGLPSLESWHIPSVCLMAAPHCASTFLAVIVLSAPAVGTRSHVHSFLSPVAFTGELYATVLKAFNTALLLLAEGSFTDCIYRN